MDFLICFLLAYLVHYLFVFLPPDIQVAWVEDRTAAGGLSRCNLCLLGCDNLFSWPNTFVPDLSSHVKSSAAGIDDFRYSTASTRRPECMNGMPAG